MKQPPFRRNDASLKMTSMIDVIFLLLVFFVCTANFAEPEGTLPADFSQSGNIPSETELPPPENLDIVHLKLLFNNVPSWSVEGTPCESLQEVKNFLVRLKNVKQDIPVVLMPDKNVPMKYVIDGYDICRSVGLTKIMFAAE
ncbi:biopolymer transporter ExbD [Planctomycetales bacterium]|nr:biopolymer transporter ExbD [Planctomycetales bacterium]